MLLWKLVGVFFCKRLEWGGFPGGKQIKLKSEANTDGGRGRGGEGVRWSGGDTTMGVL